MYPHGLRVVNGRYKDINDGFPFSESTNTSFLLNMNTFSFYALSGFSFPVEDTRRRIVFEDAPTNVNLMFKGAMSISVCPGDFSETAQCVMQVNNSKTLMFSTRASDDPERFCKLDPEKVYFANFAHSPEPGVQPAKCANDSHTKCAMFYTEALLN